jgi:hypothetical protein
MDSTMLKAALLLNVILPYGPLSSAFQPQRAGQYPLRVTTTTRMESSTSPSTADNDNAIQWELFRKYHIGNWKGVWTTYNYMGDVDIETIASVNVVEQTNEEASSQQEPKIVITHDIVKGAKTSDCTTCFDDYEIQTIPVATYTPGNLGKARLGACGMVVGPTVLRSGASKWIAIMNFGNIWKI